MGRYLNIARQALSKGNRGIIPPIRKETCTTHVPRPMVTRGPSPPKTHVTFVEASPVILGPHGEDPLDYRLDPLTGEWVYEPGWWNRPFL
ncbi:MAG: hypothetical protein ACOX13_08870 [Bacillota bacterium]